MGKWKDEFQIRDLLEKYDNPTDEQSREIAAEIAKRAREKWSSLLEADTHESYNLLEWIEALELAENTWDVDDVLDEMWDWLDYNQVWVPF